MYREKWVDKKSPLKINDLVIIADPSVTNSWRMGRILEVKEGSESQVRSVTIVLGKHKHLNIKVDDKRMNNAKKQKILSSYTSETKTVVTRPASAVAKLYI